ncbi:MAG: alpha/beta hydrolase [Candidatus Pelagibacter sp.]|nr:alpha/beta hydrolase [Candidatus Pelagibacter sp.]OUT95775.1 MAG: alpha/beta hydrolase [Gammaproteobacteria bacterium TMED36]
MILNVNNKDVFISSNGMDIDKNKPSILLMHGSGLTHIVWSLHEQFYSSQGFNVLSVDIPGHGNSEGPALKSIEEISDWVKALMKKTDIKKIIIIGHSQGGLVGIDFASRYPELTNKIVLVSSSYKMPVNQDLIDLAEAGDEKSILLMMKWGYEGSKAFIGGNPVKKIINSARDIREILAVDLKACNNYKDGENAIKKINCPTLCIFGDLDKMVPVKAGLKMTEQIKDSETKIISDCGHMIIFEKAFEMRKLVKEFIIK